MNYADYNFNAQQVYLSGQAVPGVQSINTSFEFPDQSVIAAGYTNPIASGPEGNVNGEFTVNRLIISPAEILSGYFENGVMGGLKYGEDRAYVFETGLIKSYRFEAEEGGIPANTFSFTTWGKVETSSDHVTIDNSDIDVQVLSPGDITIRVEDCGLGGAPFNASSNLIKSVSFDIEIEWTPVNTLGQLEPSTFIPKNPTTIMCEIEFEMNDFKSPDFSNFLCAPLYKNITIELGKCTSSCGTGELPLRSFILPSCQLVDFSQYSSMDDVLCGVISLKSTILTPSTMHKIFH